LKAIDRRLATSGEGLQVIGASAIVIDLATKSCRLRGTEAKDAFIDMKPRLLSRRDCLVENAAPPIETGPSPIPCKAGGFAITSPFITMRECFLSFGTSFQANEAKIISLVTRSLSISPRPMSIGAKTSKSSSTMIAVGARMIAVGARMLAIGPRILAISRSPLATAESFMSIARVPVPCGAAPLEEQAIPG
jgi:hypothetical protein